MTESDINCSIEDHRNSVQMGKDNHSDNEIKEILSSYKRVAVVGMSREEGKVSHEIPKYLIENGYDVIPVNPNADYILGKKSYKSLSDIGTEVDIIDVFRPSEQVFQIVKDAILIKPKVIWLQEGIANEEARKLAENNGIDFVFNRCMMKEHIRLFGQ